MNALVNVYLRDEQLIVAPCAGGGGVTYEIEPVLLAPLQPDDVAAAVRSSLQVSSRHMPAPVPNLRGYRSPVMAKLGVRSLRQFYRNIAYCSVYENAVALAVQAFIPAGDGKGFQLAGEPLPVSDETRLGELVVQTLEASERLNPRS